MITFGYESVHLTDDRRKPDQYDYLWWGRRGALGKIQVGYGKYDHNPYPPYAIGYEYHILTYPKFFYKKSDRTCIEMFYACLIDPLEYIETTNCLGVVGKRGPSSETFFKKLIDELTENSHLYDFVNGEKIYHNGTIDSKMDGLYV